ncbi:MAG: ABC transporter substrate-binding protein [Haloarculaceae archaeon]
MTGISRRDALRGLGAVGAAGLAGCSQGTQGTQGTPTGTPGRDPIRVGLQADLTGALASYGFWHRRVLRGYVDELNSNGGIGGRDVKLFVEDTATSSKQGVAAFRKLAQQNDCDFVIGSQSSGVSIATNPLAKQLQTPYFPIGEAPSITGSDANRWVVRNNHNVTSAAIVATEYGLSNLGKKWTVVYQNYSFGKQYLQAIRTHVEKQGGEVLQAIPVEVGTSDLSSHLNRVPDGTEVLFNALIGSSALNFLDQSAQLDVPGARLGPIASVEGVDISSLGAGAEGAAYVTMLPRRLEEFDNEYNRHLRSVARVDETDQVLNGGHYFVSYEALSWIADAIEATGWTSPDDHQAFVKWFEQGPSVEASDAYPQGPKYFRGQDHQAFMDMFVERIQDGALTVAEKRAADETTFPARVDLTQQSF